MFERPFNCLWTKQFVRFIKRKLVNIRVICAFPSRSSSFALASHLAFVFGALNMYHLFCVLHSSTTLPHRARIRVLYWCFRVALVSPAFHSCPSRCLRVSRFALNVRTMYIRPLPSKKNWVSHPDLFEGEGTDLPRLAYCTLSRNVTSYL